MEDAADAIIGSWSIQFWPTVGLVLLAIIYFRGLAQVTETGFRIGLMAGGCVVH